MCWQSEDCQHERERLRSVQHYSTGLRGEVRRQHAACCYWQHKQIEKTNPNRRKLWLTRSMPPACMSMVSPRYLRRHQDTMSGRLDWLLEVGGHRLCC